MSVRLFVHRCHSIVTKVVQLVDLVVTIVRYYISWKNPILVAGANFLVLAGAVGLVLKCSALPLPSILANTWVVRYSLPFQTINSEVNSLSLSVIASYIFYVINIYIPIKRKKSVLKKQLALHLSTLAYRTLCLIYLYERFHDELPVALRQEIYGCFSRQVAKCCASISLLFEYIPIEAVVAVNNISATDDKFIHNHHRLEHICLNLRQEIAVLDRTMELFSPAKPGEKWLMYEGNGVKFKPDSDTFKEYIKELTRFFDQSNFKPSKTIGMDPVAATL